MKNHKIFVLLLMASTIIYAQPGCRQVGNRLTMPGDSKDLQYVSCSCPCNEYEQLDRGQCAECKHYPEPHQNQFEILNDIDIDEAHRQYLEDSEE